MSMAQQKEIPSPPPPPSSKKFTHRSNELAFTSCPYDYYTTEVCLLEPPKSLSPFHRFWIVAFESCPEYKDLIFRHPLTSKPHSVTLPQNFYFSFFKPYRFNFSIYYAFGQPYSTDKLLGSRTLFALYGGGLLLSCRRYTRHRQSTWVKLTSVPVKLFDDIISFQNKIYAIDRLGITNSVNHYKTVTTIRLGKTLIYEPLTPGSERFGWRKRFAINGDTLYVVVRTEEKLFKVFRLKKRGTNCYFWDSVKKFEGNKVLFMARNHYFLRRASGKFPGREYRNCIVFSEAAFPQYGNGCWEFTQTDDRQCCEDDIAVFRLGDQRFAREEELENSGFPKIDWSPPDWIFNLSSLSYDDFKEHSSESESSSSQSDRVPNDDEGLDSDSGDKNVGELQSHLKDTNSKDEGEQEEMETEFSSQDQDQGGVASDSESKDQEDEEMPKVSTSSSTSTEGHKRSVTATTKFEGLDIRSDLVPTLQKIWQRHGNIIKDSIVRSGDIVARALESLATMVQILEDNPIQSLSDSQAVYLNTTL